MPVIINEFEIVVEPPASGPRGAGGGDDEKKQEESQPAIKPEDIILVEQVHRERMERVRAD